MRVVVIVALIAFVGIQAEALRAGVSKVDATLPIGAPLAGYNYPPRRATAWPLPTPGRNYTTFMNPSIGIYDPNWIKALIMEDDNGTRFGWVALDFIGADLNLIQMGYDFAVADGFKTKLEDLIVGAMHTHSAGGAISSDFLWSFAPATDLLVPELQRKVAKDLARALLEAEQNMVPALLDAGQTKLPGVTHNRRTSVSPYVNYDYVDESLGILRVDTLDHKPLATVWNFAIHSICYDAPNMMFTSDVAGAANMWIEENIGGVSLFSNGAAGDVNPRFDVACKDGTGPRWSGGQVIGSAVQKVHQNLVPIANPKFAVFSHIVEFGSTRANLTLARLLNCTKGGYFDICSLCTFLHCSDNVRLGSSWIQNTPRFTGARITLANRQIGIASIPGEAITELGQEIRNDTLALGFDTVFLAGYSNAHLGYFTTPREYIAGGYESILTLWGINTSEMIRQGCKTAMQNV